MPAQPDVGSVASVFISRWTLRSWQGSDALRDQLGIAIAKRTYKACRTLLSRPAGSASTTRARPQRLLWASTGTKDPEASDILYIKALRRRSP